MIKTVTLKRSDYDAIPAKDPSCFYFTDDGCFFKGSDKYIREADLGGEVSVGSLRVGRYVFSDDGTGLIVTNSETQDVLEIF